MGCEMRVASTESSMEQKRGQQAEPLVREALRLIAECSSTEQEQLNK